MGLISFLLGALATVLLSGWWFLSRLDNWGLAAVALADLHLHERAVFYYSLAALLLGAQFMSIGFLAELFTAYYQRHAASYSIKQVAGRAAREAPVTASFPTTDERRD